MYIYAWIIILALSQNNFQNDINIFNSFIYYILHFIFYILMSFFIYFLNA
jgi:hypothetical protein